MSPNGTPHSEWFVTGEWNGSTAQFRRDRLIVSVAAGAPVGATLSSVERSLASDVEGLRIENPRTRPWAILMFSPLPDAATRIPSLAATLAARPDLRYAEPDFICTEHDTPNDSRYGEQWWAEKIGIEDMWDVTHGSSRVLLAIVDSGISMRDNVTDHPDLSGSRYVVAHQWGGWHVPHDYTWEVAPVWPPFLPPPPPRDGRGHGTHVAGIAAAQSNNLEGVAGANWNSPVYIARVLDSNGHGSVSMVKLAVHDILQYWRDGWWAFLDIFGWLQKRIVINLSLGFHYPFDILNPCDSLLEVCEETAGGKVMLCAAAASRGSSNTQIGFPAAYAAAFDHVIAVGSTNNNDPEMINLPILDDYSAITIFAPGAGILSTTPDYPCTLSNTGRYTIRTGTSQACPLVAGAISLIWSADRLLTPAEIRQRLLSSAVKLKGGYPRLNLRRRKVKWKFPWI